MNPNKKILIVDDENFIRLLLHRTLEDFEFENVEISVASDGEQGLAMALEQTPDLIFLDLMMPRLDGLEVCQRIRENEKMKDTYVVLLTAKGNVPLGNGDAGPDCSLTKPFDPDQIIALTSEVLGIDVDDGF